MITAHGDIHTAIAAMRHGAYDYYEKSSDPEELYAILDRAFEKHSLLQERQQAEAERDHVRNFLNTVIENVPATLVVRDARNHRYALVNRAGEEFFGLARTNIIGKTVHDLFPKEEADAIMARDNEVLQSGRQLMVKVIRCKLLTMESG